MPDASHVLVVDDHPQMVALMRRWLVRAGYHVTGVTTVQEALAALAEHDLAWVISDLMLSCSLSVFHRWRERWISRPLALQRVWTLCFARKEP